MGAVAVTGVADLKREFQAYRREIERMVTAEMKAAAMVVMQSLMDRTPVWEGTVVRNYRVALGALPSGAEIQAINTGDPGPTGSMGAPPAGEPRRSANEAAAVADAEGVLRALRRVGVPVFITNTATHWDLVENGSAPTPDRARNPGGVSALALQTARSKLGDRIE
jgi:hypothetical protein